MLILSGSVALSDFRRAKLLNALQTVVPSVTAVQAEYVHFVRTRCELGADEHARLQALLTYEEVQGDHNVRGTLFLVTPRTGTISPWSSKATDIAHNCGLNTVERVERGIASSLELAHRARRVADISLEVSERSLRRLDALVRELRNDWKIDCHQSFTFISSWFAR